VTITYSAQPKPEGPWTHKATKVKEHHRPSSRPPFNPEGLKDDLLLRVRDDESYGKTTAKHSLKAGTSAKGVSAAIKV